MESVQGPQGHDDDWLMSRFRFPKSNSPRLQSHEWDKSNGKLGLYLCLGFVILSSINAMSWKSMTTVRKHCKVEKQIKCFAIQD